MGRILGIDYGERRVGLAVSDETGTVACGLGVATVSSRAEALAAVLRAAAETGAETLVVGLPLNMNGSSGAQAEAAREFAVELAMRAADRRVKLWDERLSSAEAERVLIAGNASRARRREIRDKLAAQLILQSFLEANSPAEHGASADWNGGG